MNDGIIHRAAPFVRHLGRQFIRSSQGRGKDQLVLQRRAHPLMRAQPPHFPNRNAPAVRLRILPLPHRPRHPPDDCSAAAASLCADAAPSGRSGGKTPPARSAASCRRCSRRRRVHSRPSSTTSSSISRNARARGFSEVIVLPFVNCFVVRPRMSNRLPLQCGESVKMRFVPILRSVEACPVDGFLRYYTAKRFGRSKRSGWSVGAARGRMLALGPGLMACELLPVSSILA